MPLPASLKLFIEPTLGLAYSSFTGSTQVSNPSLYLGDKAQLEIYLVKDTGVPSYPREEIAYPAGLSLRVALGPIDESPTGGTWKLSYGGDTTSAIPYNATTAQLQSALNALASITSAGGVTVTKVGDNYNILFNNVGARTELTTDATSLTPLSTAGVATLQVGDGSKPQIYLVHLQRTVAGLATTFNQVTASSITVSTITAWDGTRATYRVAISPDPKGGTFSLNFDALSGTDVSTSAISVGASGIDLLNALNVTGSALAGKVSVQQLGAYTYDITVLAQPGTNGLTANASGLLSFNGYTGELDLNTSSAIALLDGAESVATFLEVEITSNSKPITVLQIPVTFRNAVTDEGSVQPLVLESYLTQTTADGRYLRISNNLSEATASTVRTNIDVYSTGQVDTALALKLSAANNLSELTPTAATARTNLGLGSMATETASDYLSKAGNLSGLASVSTARTNLGLGTMATETATDYLSKAGNLSGLASVSTARTNLGLGTMATETASDYLSKAGNLSGLASTSTARTNLGLGTMATETATNYAALSGATFAGKVNLPSRSGSGIAYLNLGLTADNLAVPSTLVEGDIFFHDTDATSGYNVRLAYTAKSFSGSLVNYSLAVLQNQNFFTQPQTISCTHNTQAAVRITQTGTGEAIRVEDSTNPDTSAFIVGNDGKVGVQVNSVATSPATFWVNGTAQVDGHLTIGSGWILYFGTKSLTIENDVGSNTLSGNFSASEYPYEVQLKVNGVNYAIPARMT